MKRKVIKQGHSTLTITLPSEWTKRFNLKTGSEIDLIERENGLFISTEAENNRETKTEFNIKGMDIPTIWKHFMAVYREGYDEVTVKFPEDIKLENPYKHLTEFKEDKKYSKQQKKNTILEVLQSYTNRFIGYEIIEHSKNHIKIKEMGNITSKEFDNSFRRVILLIEQMLEEINEAIENNDNSNMNHIHDIDINLDKFHDYCIRILNKVKNKSSNKTALLFSTLYILELVGDEFKHISFHLIEDNKSINTKKIKVLSNYIREQFETYKELYFNYGLDKVQRISEIDRQILSNIRQLYQGTSNEEKELFHHFRIIGRYLNSLTEIRIELEF